MNKITGKIDLFFHIGERGSSFSKEIIGGITTFLTMSYILAVNPMILGGAEGPGPGAVFTATVLSAAVAPALVLVGFLMMKNVRFIDFDDPTEGLPSFLCLAAIPFTYSISQGIVWGVLSYVLLKAVTGRRKEVSPLSWGLALFFLAYVLVKSFV